jgi:CheY-like chemotaxis protein/HPt (histidine-containing phosphotransfer) domain-containing protein
LLIPLGRRLRPRPASEDVITLDGNFLRRSALLRSVAVAAGRASPEVVYGSSAGDVRPIEGAAPSIAQARAQGRLLLIAEDDLVNQKVILRQIELLGYAAEIAGDGATALRLWREGQYAILLTDLHMPAMDGFTLAETIRREEARHPLPLGRIPILALTANALLGEAEKARGVGMDDYLTKPLRLEQLNEALRRWLRSPPSECEPTMPAPLMQGAALDLTELESRVGSDPVTLREFLIDYRSAAKELAAEICAAHESSDLRRLGDVAHRLKSSSRAVGALHLGDICAELENGSRVAAHEPMSRLIRKFRRAIRDVEAEISVQLSVA